MKKFLFAFKSILLCMTIVALLVTMLQVFPGTNPLAKLNVEDPVYNGKEEFEPALARLNSLKKLEKYCDSIYKASNGSENKEEFEKNYTDIASSVLRKRFYHGYSHYGFNSNYVAALVSRVTVQGYSAIVIPEDIMKYPFAACSQQSIIMMELLKKKNISTRKIGFQGNTTGHFGFEVFYNDDWHFYDTNMEPDADLLNSFGRPGIAFLAANPELLLKAYSNHSPEKIMDVFPTYVHGTPDKFPAPNGIIFQKASKFLSYSCWLFLLLAYFIVNRWYNRVTLKHYVRNRRVHFPQSQTGTSSAYYPRASASGS